MAQAQKVSLLEFVFSHCLVAGPLVTVLTPSRVSEVKLDKKSRTGILSRSCSECKQTEKPIKNKITSAKLIFGCIGAGRFFIDLSLSGRTGTSLLLLSPSAAAARACSGVRLHLSAQCLKNEP